MNFKFLFIFLILLCNFYFVSGISIEVHVPEKYTDVVAGERFYFEISVKYPENPSRKDLILEYEILNTGGEMIAQSKVLKAIETQSSFIDFIVIPENTKKGFYLIKINVKDYEELNEEVGSSFHVRGGENHQVTTYFYILLFSFLIVGGLVVISLFRKKK